MITPLRFRYGSTKAGISANNQLAHVPIVLRNGSHSVTALGLLDTGSTVNVLPLSNCPQSTWWVGSVGDRPKHEVNYGQALSAGLQLGFVWDEQTTPLSLTGTLAQVPARGVIVSGQVGSFVPVDLAFAWTLTDEAPLLLGQINFFMEFDVCFFRSLSMFEVSPKGSSHGPS